VNGATGGVEQAQATKSRPGCERRVECLLLEIALGIRDVTLRYERERLRETQKLATTTTNTTPPRRLLSLLPLLRCCHRALPTFSPSFERLIHCGSNRDSKGRRSFCPQSSLVQHDGRRRRRLIGSAKRGATRAFNTSGSLHRLSLQRAYLLGLWTRHRQEDHKTYKWLACFELRWLAVKQGTMVKQKRRRGEGGQVVTNSDKSDE
jgi:hypothetical protein